MKTTKKNQPVEGNRDYPQHQGEQVNQTPPPSVNDSGYKPATMEEDTEEIPNPRREYDDREHQHDYITPKGQDYRKDINNPPGAQEQYT